LSQAKATITYTPRPNATPEAELDALAAAYRFILERRAKRLATESGSCNDAGIVENTEGVSHVEQRPDRPSEVAKPAAL
jgi:hypothetical protein